MLKRPNREETEEDLLKQQTQFFKSLNKEAPAIPQEDVQPAPAPTKESYQIPGIIGDIVERRGTEKPFSRPIASTGFPKAFVVDPTTNSNKRQRKSLFAMKMKENGSSRDNDNDKMEVEEPKAQIDQEMQKIHDENVSKLASMTQEEIDTQKKMLEASLDKDMLAFLKSRGAKKKIEPVKIEKPTSEGVKIEEIDMNEVKQNLLSVVDEQWLEMDKIEPEKLQWIGDIPDSKSLDPDKEYSARFDFAGDLQPFRTEIDVTKSLHHHGEESDRPGYTIQELYQLARSTVLQQRILALNTLANIIQKTKMGYYDQCFDGVLLRKLVDSDLFFLLRFSMDDRFVTTAAVNCLHAFFVSPADEICLTRLLNITADDVEPYLYVELELDKDSEEGELKDHQILAQDIVRGVVRTDLLVRFSYVLREFEPDKVTIAKIMECIIRICRHSNESCQAVYSTHGLMTYVFSNLNSSEPIYQCLALIRVMLNYSDIADKLKNVSFSFILNFIDMDQPAFKLKLESLSLWKALIRQNMFISEVSSFAPCLTRLILFYIEKVDVCHGRFDFELFAGIVSMLTTANSVAMIARSYLDNVGICLRKWLWQMKDRSDVNYSVAKAIYAGFKFLMHHYSKYGVEKSDVELIDKLRKEVGLLLNSDSFSNLAERLLQYSHISHYNPANRDPVNSPSLNSIYENASNHLMIVQDQSVLPLFIGLSEFLLKSYEISHLVYPELQTFSKIFFGRIEKLICKHATMSWFSRYELMLITNILEIQNKVAEATVAPIAFQSLCKFRLDDSNLFIVLKWTFADPSIHSIYAEYFSSLFKEKYFHDCKTVPVDWIYGPISQKPLEVLQTFLNIYKSYPKCLKGISHTVRYYQLCKVLLNETHLLQSEIKECLHECFRDIVENIQFLDLNIKVTDNKSFYELYTELVIQYAGTSYGDELFAKFITLPLAQSFDISFRKLLWSEYMHALRVITLSDTNDDFISISKFVDPIETDESLLALYLNAISNKVITKERNGLIFSIAVENVRGYNKLEGKDLRLSRFLMAGINALNDENLKTYMLS